MEVTETNLTLATRNWFLHSTEKDERGSDCVGWGESGLEEREMKGGTKYDELSHRIWAG